MRKRRHKEVKGLTQSQGWKWQNQNLNPVLESDIWELTHTHPLPPPCPLPTHPVANHRCRGKLVDSCSRAPRGLA